MNKPKKVITFDIDEDGMKGVKAVSLVDFPAIESNFIALGKAEVKLSTVSEERRMLYGAALIPDKLILRIDPETKEEYYVRFPKKSIERIAYNFMKAGNHHNATFMHEFSIAGCTVVETWLKENENDKSVALGLDAPDGTWFIGMKVDSDEVWQEVKDGKVMGFSIEGFFDSVDQAFRVAEPSEEEKILNEIEALFTSK